MSAVFCLARDQNQAITITDALRAQGFTGNDISVLLPDKSGTRDFAHEQNTKAPEGAAAGGVTGGVLGGALGWIVGIGALAIPGVGPFIAAGPIMAALSGAAIGASLGGLTGALVGMGIPELEAKLYEGKIKAGNVLIAVHTDDREEAAAAERVFADAGATDIKRGSEASAPTVETRVNTARDRV
jgi:hypothetical protein